jgi:hypothetical protein
MADHTARPWESRQTDPCEDIEIVAPRGGGLVAIVTVGATRTAIGLDEQQRAAANARLIAAAPELLDLVREFVRAVKHEGRNSRESTLLRDAEVAIAKAEGR